MMKLLQTTICVFCIAITTALAQQTPAHIPQTDSLQTTHPDSVLFTNFNTNLDSLINLYYVKQSQYWKYLNRPPGEIASTEVPDFSSEIYKQRIAEIPTVIPLAYNEQVHSYINVYAFKRRSQVEIMMGLAEFYFPMFEEVFEQYNVPQELKYLAIIESALNPRATSPVGAAGLWQFMPATGKIYRLEVNSLIDERRDPVKSTVAAAQYLGTLYSIFNDWLLAIAAYNCGPGNVRKAIVRSGGKTNFWDIYYHLPKETRGYVPAYIAAYYVFEHHDDHNLWAREIHQFPVNVDTLQITQRIHLQQISEVLNMPLQLLQDINPHCRTGVFPYSERATTLYLPMNYVSPFLQFQDSIFAYNDSILFHNKNLMASPGHNSGTGLAVAGNKTIVYYYVKQGDNLGLIAKWYNVSVQDLKTWNSMRSTKLSIGKKLAVEVPSEYRNYYSKITSMSLAQKQKLTRPTAAQKNTVAVAHTTTAKSPNNQTTIKQASDGKNYLYHTVVAGETLYSIAQKYDDVTINSLRTLNNMGNSSKLSIGMKLKIKEM
ncbi:MAG: transglycosylase SLT domain-containing protein [Bacteroidales bacterium]|jgi:membrane-bound lytic murein transglycosylase D|nr:transglycosylase SLT domain-containing protein [Bacteroidales bacterium]